MAMTLRDYGLHELIWDGCDDFMGGTLVASPADARGRGIRFSCKPNGNAVSLAGAAMYLVWRHRVNGKRGCEPFTEREDGTRSVFYPAAMQECAGVVDAQVMVSFSDERTISTRVFGIRVEPVLIGGTESADGFTLFVDVIKRYEEGAQHVQEMLDVLGNIQIIKGEKGDKGDKGDPGVDGKDGAPGKDGVPGRDGADGAPGRDGADGKDGLPGKDGTDGRNGIDGISPKATVVQTSDGAIVTVTDRAAPRQLCSRMVLRVHAALLERKASKAKRLRSLISLPNSWKI